MGRLLLVCTVLLPFTAFPQETKSALQLHSSQQLNLSSGRSVGDMSRTADPDPTSPERVGSTTILSLSGLETNAPPQSSKRTQPKKTKKPSAPPIESSMVGYIANAIIGSEIRIRFDAGFHNDAPDRAEFFYPQCSCINGPGPNAVIADLNFQQLYIRGEYALNPRFSVFTEVPVRWLQPKRQIVPSDSAPLPNEAGLSDVVAGIKLAAVASSNRYLTFQLQAYFPSGSASEGLGTDHYSIEPALLYYQKLSDRLALEAQVGDLHPIGGSYCPLPCDNRTTSPTPQHFSGDVFFYGIGPSYTLYRGEKVRIAPVVELVGWRVLGP